MGDSKGEVIRTAKHVTAIFSEQYTKAYTNSLVQFSKEQVKGYNETESDQKLLKRPSWNENYKSGYLVKEGGNTKSMKKRWFVVKPNFSVEYYHNEAAVSKGPKGVTGRINLCGYWVVTDPNSSNNVRLKKLAERLGVDLLSAPKPKEYPLFTMELYHPNQRCYYLTAETREQFDEWVNMFRMCCWESRGFTVRDDVHKRAFHIAVRNTRWALGHWDRYDYKGTEEQVLTYNDIIPRACAKLVGPFAIRNMLYTQMLKSFDVAVMDIVKPTWASLVTSTDIERALKAPKIREFVGQIYQEERVIVKMLKELYMDTVTPLLEKCVSSFLAKILEIVKKPISDAFNKAISLFDAKISKFDPIKGSALEESFCDLQETQTQIPVLLFCDLDRFPRSYEEMKPAISKTEVMVEGLWCLWRQDMFPDIWPANLSYQVQVALRELTDNAVYTWQQGVIKQLQYVNVFDKTILKMLQNETITNLQSDAEITAKQVTVKIIKQIVLPPFEQAVQSVARPIIDSLISHVPGPLQEFVDIQQLFEDFYNEILDDTIRCNINQVVRRYMVIV